MIMGTILTVDKLSVNYQVGDQTLPAVDDVSFSIGFGESLGLVGESGAGKSSLALALMRLLPTNVANVTGDIVFAGDEMLSIKEHVFHETVRWKKIAMVFQGAMESLNPVLRVGDQVAEPLWVTTEISKTSAIQEARRLLDLMQLPSEVYQRYPHELSGGMKQRVLIAMALIHSPNLLVLDESTSALDVTVQAQIMDQLKDLKTDLGLTVIFITHDIALASDLCDTIGVMYAGQLVELGPAEVVLTEPRHPYTQLLLASIPRLLQEKPPEFIPGNPPDIMSLPRGCHFHPRCPEAFDRCSLEEPLLLPLNRSHWGRCWLLQ